MCCINEVMWDEWCDETLYDSKSGKDNSCVKLSRDVFSFRWYFKAWAGRCCSSRSTRYTLRWSLEESEVKKSNLCVTRIYIQEKWFVRYETWHLWRMNHWCRKRIGKVFSIKLHYENGKSRFGSFGKAKWRTKAFRIKTTSRKVRLEESAEGKQLERD